MAPKFGTSGLRGLVTELTSDLVADYTRAFLAACPNGGAVYVGRDLRASSPRIAEDVIAAARAEGVDVTDCGALPTPALALASMRAGAAAIMVTGSHIPADRNGLKFYLPSGEISKADEEAITAHLGRAAGSKQGSLQQALGAGADYVARYVQGFGSTALAGLRIGVYEHSSVARDIMGQVMQGLGAQVVPLGRSETFIPVDTEALDAETRAMLEDWCRAHDLDAVISTDGDADRPMLAGRDGAVVPGDVLGALTARALGADVLCTPVSSNSMVQQMPEFAQVHLTRIGSPFVIAAMEQVLSGHAGARVVGYEANGGFLLGFAAQGPAGILTGSLAPLMTRDCLLPIVAPLAAARAAGQGLADLVAALPPVFTAADRLQGIAQEDSAALLARLGDAQARADFFEAGDPETGLDRTDGLRVSFEGGLVVHLRPSGNAPEFRCYAEAPSPEAANALVAAHLTKLARLLAPDIG